MDTNQDNQAQLDLQRIQMLFQQAGFTYVGISVSSAVVVYTILPVLHWQITLAWLMFSLLAIPIRIFLYTGFNAELKSGHLSIERAKIWEQRWVIVASLPAIAFASSGYLPYSGQHLIIFLFIGLVLVSMIAGSVVSSTTSIKTVMVFINFSLIPFIVRCFMETGEYYWALGFLFLVFYIVFISLARRMNHTVLEAIKLQIERQEMANKDSLTGLWNRRKLFDVLEKMTDKPYSILLIDVDHFKQFNDDKGHSKGDEKLNEISLSIVRSVNKKDLVVRYGGEEFLVLLTETSAQHAKKVAHNIRERVIIDSASTVSIGIADTELEKDFDKLIDFADKAMYQAKSDGRNCVRIATKDYRRLKTLA